MMTETVIVGAGHAGLTLSRLLAFTGRDHVVLERGQVAERWRSERWDSLRLITPNRMSRLAGGPAHPDPDGYLSRDEVVAQLERYARSFRAPLRPHTEVLRVRARAGGFGVETDRGTWTARNVVVATGWCNVPRLPALANELPDGVLGLHASRYRAPEALPGGGVLVVGAGPSGQQIALELARAGRAVTIAVGRHSRA